MVVLEFLHVVAVAIGLIVVAAIVTAIVFDRWQLRKCAKRGHDFTRGPVCGRCETPQPVMTTRKGF